MSLSKESENNKIHRPRYSAPWFYYNLTFVQAGTAAVFTTFLVTHLSATALATFGGIELANKAVVFGRVYYQNRFLEPIVVFGSLCGHVISGLTKFAIRKYWKYKKQDPRKLSGEVRVRVEKTVTDEQGENGAGRQKITTKTITTIAASIVTRALMFIGPYHNVTGYILIPLILTHVYVNRFLPRCHFGDSSMINLSYSEVALKRWPRSTYLGLITFVSIGMYHVGSGLPVVLRILKGLVTNKKNGEKVSESEKKRQSNIRNGIIVTTIGLVTAGLLVIGGKIGKDNNIQTPLHREYLKVYGRVYPQSWVRD